MALITDGRFSGGTPRRLHRPRHPRSRRGRAAGLVQDGDRIAIDLDRGTLDLLVDPAEVQRRLAALPPFEPQIDSRWLRRYARLVSSASTGAVFLD